MEQREDEMGTYCMEFTREGKKSQKQDIKKQTQMKKRLKRNKIRES